MNIDAKTLIQMRDQILDQTSQMLDQMSQMLTYFAILSILQIIFMFILVYLWLKESRANKKIFTIILKQNMNLEEEIQKSRNVEQKIDRQLNNLLKNTKKQSTQIAHYYPEISTSEPITANSFRDSFSENSTISDDPKFKELIKAYNQGQGSDVFISLKIVIDNLIKNGSVNSEEEATRMINKLTRIYPSAIMVENVRGEDFPQIAIIN